jgi:hypothetical protein
MQTFCAVKRPCWGALIKRTLHFRPIATYARTSEWFLPFRFFLLFFVRSYLFHVSVCATCTYLVWLCQEAKSNIWAEIILLSESSGTGIINRLPFWLIQTLMLETAGSPKRRWLLTSRHDVVSQKLWITDHCENLKSRIERCSWNVLHNSERMRNFSWPSFRETRVTVSRPDAAGGIFIIPFSACFLVCFGRDPKNSEILNSSMGRYSVVGIAIRCGLEYSGFETRRRQEILPYPHTSRPALGRTHSAIPWVPGQSPRDKATGAWPWPPISI